MRSRFVVLTVVLLVTAGVIARASVAEPVPPRESLANFPMAIGAWAGQPGAPFDPKILEVLGVDEYVNLTFTQPGRNPLGLYVGYYGSQRQGDAIHSPLNCLPGAGWQPVSKEDVAVPVAGGDIRINKYLIEKGAERMLVLYWYQSHGRAIANEYTSRAFMVWDAMRTGRIDAALVRVIVPVIDSATGLATAEKDGLHFVSETFPVLGKFLPS